MSRDQVVVSPTPGGIESERGSDTTSAYPERHGIERSPERHGKWPSIEIPNRREDAERQSR